MQVIAHNASAALAPTHSDPAPLPVVEESTALRQTDAMAVLEMRPIEPPSKADAQSVVQAQINDPDAPTSTREAAQEVTDTEETEAVDETVVDETVEENTMQQIFEKQAEDAARTKSIMGFLPASPTQMSKLMSAVAAATSAEAIADIKLEA